MITIISLSILALLLIGLIYFVVYHSDGSFWDYMILSDLINTLCTVLAALFSSISSGDDG